MPPGTALRNLLASAAIAALALLAVASVHPVRTGIGGRAAAGARPAGAASGAGADFEAAPNVQLAPRTVAVRSSDFLLADEEFVFGPPVRGFDTGAFLATHDESLAAHTETLRGRARGAAEIVDIVAVEHSISPRLLLAVLAVAGVAGSAGTAPVGEGTGPSLVARLERAAAWLADGFYGLRYRGEQGVHFADGSSAPGPTAAGAAHYAVARYLALDASPATWAGRLATFAATYDAWFGPPPPPGPPGSRTAAVGPLPPLLLPWPEGKTWHYTGGPHGGWGVASAWAAVDFAPPTWADCEATTEWAVAAAPGTVVHAADGLVLQDLDGDGFAGTGWVLVYLHVATADRVAVGTRLTAGDPLGHPSCEGGHASGAHLHFARRYDGAWVPAGGGPAPLALSGWTFDLGHGEYDGSAAHAEHGIRTPVASRRDGATAITSDNGPLRRQQLAADWAAAAAVP